MENVYFPCLTICIKSSLMRYQLSAIFLFVFLNTTGLNKNGSSYALLSEPKRQIIPIIAELMSTYI